MRNGADEPIEVMWGHHPALGAPFLEPGCTISAPANTFRSDDRAPGIGLAAGARSEWPHAALEGGGTVDLSVIPPAGEARAVLGYLTDFDEGRYRVANPRLRPRARAALAARALPDGLVLAGAPRVGGLPVVPAALHDGARAEQLLAGTGPRERAGERRLAARARRAARRARLSSRQSSGTSPGNYLTHAGPQG